MSKPLTLDQGRSKHPSLMLHVLGLTLSIAGIGILVSCLVEAIDGGSDVLVLMVCGVVTTAVGLASWILTEVPRRIQTTDVFTTVTISWLLMSIAAAIPYVLTGALPAIDDALFEAVSGLSTTGATVMPEISANSQGILFWRAITQWLGGMGVIVLVVAVLPAVGAGGMSLLEAEAPGPTGERLTPRVRHTARRLWGVYLGFTVVVAVAYKLAGMSVYDAASHSLTTVSTGGFSPHDDSIGHFNSAVIEWIAIVSMFIAGTSFTLLYRVLRGKVGSLWTSAEFRMYVSVVAGAIALIYWKGGDQVAGVDGFRDVCFAVTAITSTTGYGTADFGQWADAAQVVLLALMPIGAMAGSTSGGVKLVRVLAVTSFAVREILRQVHPGLVRPTRIGKSSLDDKTTNQVVGFTVLTLGLFIIGAIYNAMAGADLVTAFSASATAIGNVGPGLGEISPAHNFLNVPRSGRWLSMLLMLLGRLEIYPILAAAAAFKMRFSPGRMFSSR